MGYSTREHTRAHTTGYVEEANIPQGELGDGLQLPDYLNARGKPAPNRIVPLLQLDERVRLACKDVALFIARKHELVAFRGQPAPSLHAQRASRVERHAARRRIGARALAEPRGAPRFTSWRTSFTPRAQGHPFTAHSHKRPRSHPFILTRGAALRLRRRRGCGVEPSRPQSPRRVRAVPRARRLHRAH